MSIVPISTAIDKLSPELSENQLYIVASNKTRRRIMMLLRSGKILSVSEYRQIVRLDNPHAAGNSAPAVKAHFKRLIKYGLIHQISGHVGDGRIKRGELKVKEYKITERGRQIFDLVNGLFKPKQEPATIRLQVEQSG